jgi:hypothetical protein
MEIELHGYYPAEIVFNGVLGKILQQAWEMGETELTLIRALRNDQSLRQWIKHTTLDCRQIGCTSIALKRNSHPTRKQLDCF